MEERGEKRLKRVNIIVDVEIFCNRKGLHLLLDGEEGLAYLVDGCLGLYFEHEFADVEGLDAGNRGTVGTEDSVAEDGAEAVAHICCQMVEQLVVAMAEINIDEAVERWVVEEFAFFHLGAEHLPKVALGDLADDVSIGRAGLEDDKPWGVVATGTTSDLAEGLESAFVGAEVGEVEHGVCIEDADDGYVVEVEAFGDHLGANEDVGFVLGKVGDDTLEL